MTVQNVPNEDSDQPARMRRLIWIFAGHIAESTFCDILVNMYHIYPKNADTQVRWYVADQGLHCLPHI